MSFPNHDPNWTDAADVLAAHAKDGARILAPDLFWRRFPKIFRYANTHIDPAQTYDWVLAHKGELDKLGRNFLENLQADYQPLFANPVFVLLSADRSLPGADPGLDDVKSLWENLRSLASTPAPSFEEPDLILPDQGLIEVMATLDDMAFRQAMNRFWSAGGYIYTTLRDQAYYAEIDAYIDDFVGKAEGQQVLDLCCGVGRLGNLVSGARQITGVDVADVAVDMASERHEKDARFSFQQMDAHRLDFADATFDCVLFVDAIEHVMRAGEVIAEAARVLKPSGRLFVTVANRDSLHEFMNRKLGFGEFETNYQHIREFTYPEVEAMASEHGFKVVRDGGIFLYPYWGIPGVDQAVRHLTDNDPETVELFRLLGRKVGSRHAYAFVMLLEKA